jgi:hypothetical protein
MDKLLNGTVAWVFVSGFVAPVAVMFVFFTLSRWLPHWSYLAALVLSVAVGVLGIARQPWAANWRLVLAYVIYVPTIVFILLIVSLLFFGIMYGQWL